MSTIVFFHAHPDDECSGTGGTIARASEAGHRTVVVTATGGEHGEVAPGSLPEGMPLVEKRATELADACRILGVAHGYLLGYEDSGMVGTPENENPGSFWQADLEEAAERLATILRDEQADVLTIYDEHGNYGHPDHIQVHRVGARAAELAGTPRVYLSTMNRDHFRRLRSMFEDAQREGTVPAEEEGLPDPDGFGEPESRITTVVDVSPYVDRKRRALMAHETQIPPDSFFLSMPEEAFQVAFGTEWFIRFDREVDSLSETWILDG